jgi:hypothetical protein
VETDECMPALLANGSVLVTLRADPSGGWRRQARSDDAGETIADFRTTSIPDNGNTSPGR